MNTTKDVTKDLLTYVEIALEDLGLNKIALLREDPAGDKMYSVRGDKGYEYRAEAVIPFVFFQKDVERGDKHIIETFRQQIESWREQVLASPTVRKLREEKAELEIKLKNREREISMLEPYETHYRMQYKMQHGRELES